MLFQWLKRKSRRRKSASDLYQAALTQSRQSEFYDAMAVADTMDGRFDLLSLHMILLIDRLNTLGGPGRKLGQALFDSMFKRMELDLREMGIGDLGVPKHMQKMMKAFNGRAHAYQTALEAQDASALEIAVAKNIYRNSGDVTPQAKALAGYVQHAHGMLASASLDDLSAARVAFPAFAQTMNKAA